MDDITQKVMEHDFIIKELSSSIHELVASSKEINKRLNEINISISNQSLILEKIADLETTTKENAKKINDKINDVKIIITKKDENGCSALRIYKEKEAVNDTRIMDNVKSNQERIRKLESTATWVIRTIIGTLIGGSLGIAFYMMKG